MVLYKITSLSIHAVIPLKSISILKNKKSEYCFLVYTKSFRLPIYLYPSGKDVIIIKKFNTYLIICFMNNN